MADGRAIVVPHGGIDQIADVLAREGVIGNPLSLRLAALATRGQGALHSAELYFPAHASLATVLVVLRTGKPVQHRFTIPEGLTAAQVAALLDRAPALEGETPIPAEGSLLPETYSYELVRPASPCSTGAAGRWIRRWTRPGPPARPRRRC